MIRAGSLEQSEQGRWPGTERTGQAVWDGGSGQVAYPRGGRAGQWGIEEGSTADGPGQVWEQKYHAKAAALGLVGRRQKKKKF